MVAVQSGAALKGFDRAVSVPHRNHLVLSSITLKLFSRINLELSQGQLEGFSLVLYQSLSETILIYLRSSFPCGPFHSFALFRYSS